MAEPEFLRGRNMPPPPPTKAQIPIIGEARQAARHPVQEIANAVLERIMHEIIHGDQQRTFLKAQGTADVGLAIVTVETSVRVQIKQPPGG